MTQSILRKSRITKRFNLTSLGRHAFCKAKSRAGDATVFAFPVENLRPRLQVNRLLYGLNQRMNAKEKEQIWFFQSAYQLQMKTIKLLD
jgi:hypothetical protein